MQDRNTLYAYMSHNVTYRTCVSASRMPRLAFSFVREPIAKFEARVSSGERALECVREGRSPSRTPRRPVPLRQLNSTGV